MLDHLETELVEAILLAVPARERRATLRAACLTSKRLRLVAQPLLWHNIALHKKSMLSCLAQRPAPRTPFLGAFVRTLTVDKQEVWQHAVWLLPKLEQLAEFRLRGVLVRQEDKLEVALVRVQHFSLAHGGIGGPDQQPPTLPNLVTLTLLEIQAHPSFANAWLRLARLPALRVLHVTLFHDGWYINDYPPPLDLALLSQLDFLEITPVMGAWLRSHLFLLNTFTDTPPPSPILITAPITAPLYPFKGLLAYPFLHHFHLSLPRSDAHRCGCGHCYIWSLPRDVLSGLDQLIHRLPSFHLRTLTLPCAPFGFLGEHASLELGLKPAWRRLLAVCEKEGVEVLWEEEEEERGAAKVCDVFWRWARERRAADGR
ncbi:hypothetical protein JCM8097_005736 [Rhodosporidiobolus ruineniae]